jgi:hypothetical protein
MELPPFSSYVYQGMLVLTCSQKILKEGTGGRQDHLLSLNLLSILTSQGNIGEVLLLSQKTD